MHPGHKCKSGNNRGKTITLAELELDFDESSVRVAKRLGYC